MVEIPLKTSWVRQHKLIAKPVNIEYSTKYERDAHRFEECMFLTQVGGRLVYTTCVGAYAVRNWEDVDFNLPHPLALNLASVPYKLTGDYVRLEIPNCTLMGVDAFYDKARPKYIKDSDLQTRVAAIDGKRVNLEYINPARFVERFDNIVQRVRENPIIDPTQYQWLRRDADGRIDYSDVSKVYKIVMGHDVFESYYLRFPGNWVIESHIDKLHSAVDMYGVMESRANDGVDEHVFRLPVAIFNKANQTVIWPGMGQKIR